MSQIQRHDLEAQSILKEKDAAPRANTQWRTNFQYLVPYFICNVSLMLYNKAILGKVRKSLVFSRRSADKKLTGHSLIIHGFSQLSMPVPHLWDAVYCSYEAESP